MSIRSSSTRTCKDTVSGYPSLLADMCSSVDSKNSELPPYQEHKFIGREPEFQAEHPKLYTGSCHCGAVTFALKSKPLDDVELKEDNCSICVRVSHTS